MTVLQCNPEALLSSLFDASLRQLALTLPERHDTQPIAAAKAALVGEAQYGQHRICAGRKDEDERRTAVRVSEAALQIERRRLNVARTQ